MAREKIVRFRPERPIYLNKENTNLKTDIEVELKVEELRDLGWLVVFAPDKKPVPLHICFNDEKTLSEFKKDCADLKVSIKAPTKLTEDDFLELQNEDKKALEIPGAEEKNTYEDTQGKIRVL
jgi:hypothetical protein